MSAELLRLAERCEKETAGSRELDASVWLAVTPGATREPHTIRSATNAWPDYVIDETRDATGRLVIVPSYTSSLDIAMSLVPEGWWWSGGVCKRENHASVGSEADTFTDEIIFDTFGVNLPLALCAAALKARALASRDDERGE